MTARREAIGMTDPGLLPLQVWLSPAYPVGGYAYSHGVEWAIETRDVRCRDTLFNWLSDVMRHGGGWSDAVFFAHAHDAARTAPDRIAEIAELAAAFAPSRERKLETLQQGRSFLDVTEKAWPSDALATFVARVGRNAAYPVAVALAAAAHGVALRPALKAYLLAFSSNLVSAAVRAVPLGQTDGQRVIAQLIPIVEETAMAAQNAPLDDIGGAAFRSDLASMHHETQYTRIFRS